MKLGVVLRLQPAFWLLWQKKDGPLHTVNEEGGNMMSRYEQVRKEVEDLLWLARAPDLLIEVQNLDGKPVVFGEILTAEDEAIMVEVFFHPLRRKVAVEVYSDLTGVLEVQKYFSSWTAAITFAVVHFMRLYRR